VTVSCSKMTMMMWDPCLSWTAIGIVLPQLPDQSSNAGDVSDLWDHDPMVVNDRQGHTNGSRWIADRPCREDSRQSSMISSSTDVDVVALSRRCRDLVLLVRPQTEIDSVHGDGISPAIPEDHKFTLMLGKCQIAIHKVLVFFVLLSLRPRLVTSHCRLRG